MEKSQVYSTTVPLKSRLVDFAAKEIGCESVGTVLVFHTGGAFSMKDVQGVYEPVPQFIITYLLQMPIFNDIVFKKEYEEKTSDTLNGDPMTDLINTQHTSTPSTVSIPLVMPLTKEKRRIIFRLLEYETLLDSSNCAMDQWINLAKDIERWYDDFDGFVILHGTDTLPYAASALSFIFENLSKPVVLTGAELPIWELRSDARHNLICALLFAGGGYKIPEVTVCIQNQLLRGNRVVKSSTTDLDVFISPNCPPLADMKMDIRVDEDLVWKLAEKRRLMRVHPDLCPNVGILRLFPSISTDAVRSFLRPPMQGVILQSFGAGNIPSNRPELIEIFKEANEIHNIRILNTTQCWRGTVSGVYATGAILNTVGAISGCDMTPEAALMKMAYVLGKWDDPMTQRRMLALNLRGEMTQRLTETKGRQSKSNMIGANAKTNEILDMASVKVTQKLGDLFNVADLNESAALWSRSLFPAMMCAAAETDDTDILEQLYHIAGHFEWFDHSHRSPLHLAAGAGSFASCRLMLEYGANPNVLDKAGYTPLSFAIRSPDSTPALVKLLRRFGGQLPLFSSARAREANNAARLGRIRQLRLYKLSGLTLQEFDAEGRTALHTAVVYHQTETVRYLVNDPQSYSNLYLYEAVGQESGIELRGAGVDPNQINGYGITALEEARKRGFDDIVEILETFEVVH